MLSLLAIAFLALAEGEPKGFPLAARKVLVAA